MDLVYQRHPRCPPILLINTYSWSIPSIDILISTWGTFWSILGQHSIKTWLIWNNQKLVNSQLPVDQYVNGGSMECHLRWCPWSVDRVSIKGFDQEYYILTLDHGWRPFFDTWSQKDSQTINVIFNRCSFSWSQLLHSTLLQMWITKFPGACLSVSSWHT